MDLAAAAVRKCCSNQKGWDIEDFLLSTQPFPIKSKYPFNGSGGKNQDVIREF